MEHQLIVGTFQYLLSIVKIALNVLCIGDIKEFILT